LFLPYVSQAKYELFNNNNHIYWNIIWKTKHETKHKDINNWDVDGEKWKIKIIMLFILLERGKQISIAKAQFTNMLSWFRQMCITKYTKGHFRWQNSKILRSNLR
jgi:hypothetical protein